MGAWNHPRHEANAWAKAQSAVNAIKTIANQPPLNDHSERAVLIWWEHTLFFDTVASKIAWSALGLVHAHTECRDQPVTYDTSRPLVRELLTEAIADLAPGRRPDTDRGLWADQVLEAF